MNNSTSHKRFIAIFAASLIGLSMLSTHASAASQTNTGMEFSAEQAVAQQFAPRFAATANFLTACDLTHIGAGTRAGGAGICSVRVYTGNAGDWKAYHSTVQLHCSENAPCIVSRTQ